MEIVMNFLPNVRRTLLQCGEILRNVAEDKGRENTSGLSQTLVVDSFGEFEVRVGTCLEYGLYIKESADLAGRKRAKFAVSRHAKPIAFRANGTRVEEPSLKPNPDLGRAWDAAEEKALDLLADQCSDDICKMFQKRIGKSW